MPDMQTDLGDLLPVFLVGLLLTAAFVLGVALLFICALRRERRKPCGDVPERVARTCDPCIYSQEYLLKLGQPVTWDNPDIWITELVGTNVVPSSALQPSTAYLVHARISNASINPAFGVLVTCQFANFGLFGHKKLPVELNPDGTPRIAAINAIPGFGSATVFFHWQTPAQGGHYCLFIECSHPADVFTGNNIGQENTTVAKMKAGSSITVEALIANAHRSRSMLVGLSSDAYTLSGDEVRLELERTERSTRSFSDGELRFAADGTSAVRYAYRGRNKVLEQNAGRRTSIPDGWKVEFADSIKLPPGVEQTVPVVISVPPDTPIRHVSLNVTARSDRGDMGGITIRVTVDP